MRTHVILVCMDAQQTKHATYKLAYHFILCPTYRKRILDFHVGYLDGPLAPDEAEHDRHSLAQQEYLRRTVTL